MSGRGGETSDIQFDLAAQSFHFIVAENTDPEPVSHLHGLRWINRTRVYFNFYDDRLLCPASQTLRRSKCCAPFPMAGSGNAAAQQRQGSTGGFGPSASVRLHRCRDATMDLNVGDGLRATGRAAASEGFDGLVRPVARSDQASPMPPLARIAIAAG